MNMIHFYYYCVLLIRCKLDKLNFKTKYHMYCGSLTRTKTVPGIRCYQPKTSRAGSLLVQKPH